MRFTSTLLLAFTAAMILVHLTSGRLLRRVWRAEAPGWLSVLNIFRFEGIYYLALMVYAVSQRGRFLLLPLLVMAALHVAGWAMAERRRDWLADAGGEATRARILAGVQVFDLAETVVLAYIGWVLVRAIFSRP
jgi:hypothetical protein